VLKKIQTLTGISLQSFLRTLPCAIFPCNITTFQVAVTHRQRGPRPHLLSIEARLGCWLSSSQLPFRDRIRVWLRPGARSLLLLFFALHPHPRSWLQGRPTAAGSGPQSENRNENFKQTVRTP